MELLLLVNCLEIRDTVFWETEDTANITTLQWNTTHPGVFGIKWRGQHKIYMYGMTEGDVGRVRGVEEFD